MNKNRIGNKNSKIYASFPFRFSNICLRYHRSSKWCTCHPNGVSRLNGQQAWLYIYLLAVPDSICLGRGGGGNKASEFENKKKRDGDGWHGIYICIYIYRVDFENGEGNWGKHVALEYELKSRGGSTPNIPHLITPLDTRDYIARIIG